MSEQYIDFEGTYDQLETFLSELYDLNIDDAALIADHIKEAELRNISQAEPRNFNTIGASEDDDTYYELYVRDTRHHIRIHKIIIDIFCIIIFSPIISVNIRP